MDEFADKLWLVHLTPHLYAQPWLVSLRRRGWCASLLQDMVNLCIEGDSCHLGPRTQQTHSTALAKRAV